MTSLVSLSHCVSLQRVPSLSHSVCVCVCLCVCVKTANGSYQLRPSPRLVSLSAAAAVLVVVLRARARYHLDLRTDRLSLPRSSDTRSPPPRLAYLSADSALQTLVSQLASGRATPCKILQIVAVFCSLPATSRRGSRAGRGVARPTGW